MLKVGRMENVISSDASLMRFDFLTTLNALEMPCEGLIQIPERNGEFDVNSAIFCSYHNGCNSRTKPKLVNHQTAPLPEFQGEVSNSDQPSEIPDGRLNVP